MTRSGKGLIKDLKSSAKTIGRLYPVLEDIHGNIIDGNHRLEADPEWPRMRLENITTEKDLVIASVIGNFCRRSVSSKEKTKALDALGRILHDEGVEIGRIAKTIAKETGMSYTWVMKYLPNKWKDQSQAKHTISDTRHVSKIASGSVLLKPPIVKLIKISNYANTQHAVYTVRRSLHERIERAAEILEMSPGDLVQNVIERAIRKIQGVRLEPAEEVVHISLGLNDRIGHSKALKDEPFQIKIYEDSEKTSHSFCSWEIQ